MSNPNKLTENLYNYILIGVLFTFQTILCIAMLVIWKKKKSWRYLSDFMYIQYINIGFLLSGVTLLTKLIIFVGFNFNFAFCFIIDILRVFGYYIAYVSCMFLYIMTIKRLRNYQEVNRDIVLLRAFQNKQKIDLFTI